MDYGITIRTLIPFTEAVARVREALKAQGFGVLTEIDVQATLRDKLGEEMEEYLILGACNPPLAHRALAADRRIGLLLPCNVVIRTEAGQTVIEALDPQTMVAVAGAAGPPAGRGRSRDPAPGRAGLPVRQRRWPVHIRFLRHRLSRHLRCGGGQAAAHPPARAALRASPPRPVTSRIAIESSMRCIPGPTWPTAIACTWLSRRNRATRA